MQLLLLEGPNQEPISEDEAKLYLRVEHHLDDNIIRTMIISARTMVEQYTGKTLLEQKWRMTVGANDKIHNRVGSLCLKLPMAPFQKLEGRPKIIKPTRIIELANYRVDQDAGFATLEFLVCLTDKDLLQLEFTAGYGPTAEFVPSAFKQAILMLIAEMYENRSGSNAAKAMPVVINGAVKSLLDSYRLIRMA